MNEGQCGPGGVCEPSSIVFACDEVGTPGVLIPTDVGVGGICPDCQPGL